MLASYPLVSPTTEAWITPHSLLFNPVETNQFLAGSNRCINIFDINRDGEGPISQMRTATSPRTSRSATPGMKGINSAMDISSDGVLAAGTFSRWIGLYDSYGRGGTVGVFQLAGSESETSEGRGRGVTQVIWSECGRYLCVVERWSDGVGVWDIRGTGKQLAWLGGRRAETQQRLSVDVVGGEVWAGGLDGMVRMWKDFGMATGSVEPSREFKAHDDAVSSVGLHPSGSVLLTCSGQRHWSSSHAVNSNHVENSLKFWTI